MIMYLHGFASMGEGGKYQVLKEAFPAQVVISPTLPVDPLDATDFIKQTLDEYQPPHLVIGTSLGGFYAYCTAALYRVNAIVINPAMRPWEGLDEQIGTVERFDSGGQTFEWTREHVDNLKRLSDRAGKAPGERVHFFLARDDELLDHSEIPDEYSEAATIKWFDNSGHRFERFPELIPEVKRILLR